MGVVVEDQQEMRPWRCKVELSRTASGKDTVTIRVYGEDLDAAAAEAMSKREEILKELGME